MGVGDEEHATAHDAPAEQSAHLGPSAEEGAVRRTRYDQLLKWSLTQAHDDFLRLIAPELIWQRERSPEAPAIPRMADVVWEVKQPTESIRGLLHVELQLKVEGDMGERLAEYAIRLWRRDHVPVRSVVVFLHCATTIPPSPFVIRWGQQQSMRYAYDIVRLWEIPYQQALGETPYALWPWASLMAGATLETTVTVAEQLMAAPLPHQERSELLGLLASLAGINLAREPLLAALRRSIPMIDDLLQSSSVAEGFHDEGVAEGARQMFQGMLEGRFGVLPGDLRDAIWRADLATLNAVARQGATATLEQLRTQLGLPPLPQQR